MTKGPGVKINYFIEVEKMSRPFGKNNYAAKPIVSTRVDVSKLPTRPPLYEVWGETEDDATAKVRAAMEEWAKNGGVSITET